MLSTVKITRGDFVQSGKQEADLVPEELLVARQTTHLSNPASQTPRGKGEHVEGKEPPKKSSTRSIAPNLDLESPSANEPASATISSAFSCSSWYGANNPVEDGRLEISDPSNGVRLWAVFDGHGGRRATDWLQKNLGQIILSKINKADSQVEIVR